MKYLQFYAKIFANLQGYSTFDMFQLKDVRQGYIDLIEISNSGQVLKSGLASRSGISMATEAATKI